jgi:dTDP-4-dehydrorhamnose reductase
MKIWVTGAEGMLGSILVQHCLSKGIDVVGTSRREADVVQLDAMMAKAQEIKPSHIVNCAAYTNVDEAEKEAEVALAVNAGGAANAARAARGCGARLVHISTDYVFDGNGTCPYTEEDPCAPVNQYGLSKWEGERKVLSIFPEACIVRTSWVFGSKGKNFISSLMHWFQQKEGLEVVFDQRGKPTYCHDLAAAVLTLIDANGIIHFANDGERSRYQIALDLLQACKEKGMKLKCQQIVPVPSSKFPTPAARPAYSALDTNKYFHLTNNKPRLWGEILQDYLFDYAT